jgi:hypothetical protein
LVTRALALASAAFRLGPDESLSALLADYDAVAARTEAVIADIADLGQAVPVAKGVPWFPHDVEAWSVRWVLLHLVKELARHGVAAAVGAGRVAARRALEQVGTAPSRRGISWWGGPGCQSLAAGGVCS